MARPGGDELPFVSSGTLVVQGHGIAKIKEQDREPSWAGSAKLFRRLNRRQVTSRKKRSASWPLWD